jgi:hypothetical protein
MKMTPSGEMSTLQEEELVRGSKRRRGQETNGERMQIRETRSVFDQAGPNVKRSTVVRAGT